MNAPPKDKTINPSRWPLLVAAGYFVFGTLWIIVSDQVVALLVTDDASVTRLQTYKGWGFVIITALLLYSALKILVTARQRAEVALQRSQLQFQRLIESANDGVCVVEPGGSILFVNNCLCRMLQTDETNIRRHSLRGLMDDDSATRAAHIINNCRNNGFDEFEARLNSNGNEDLWVIISASAILDEDEDFNGCIIVLTDITSRKHAEQRLLQSIESERRLLNELHHRVRNNLASLNTLIDISRRRARDVDEFAQTISGRVSAMAAAHSLLAESKWNPIRLDDLVSVLTIGLERNRIHLEGPTVSVGPGQASPLASVIHEMITNARKHGALSTETGTITIKWDVQGDESNAQQLSLFWEEDDASAPPDANASGDGLDMIKGLIRSDLRGSIEYSLENGARFRIRIPLDKNREPIEPQSTSLN